MANGRKLAFLLGALMVMGAGLSGCEEDNFTCTECGPTGGEDGSIPVNVNEGELLTSLTNKDLQKASECTKSDCTSRSACSTGAGFLACSCVTNMDTCHTYVACNGIGDCSYTCGEGDSCSYAACRKDPACTDSSSCNPDNLDANGDADSDGIPNGIELASTNGLDPCNSDSDGDTVPDNMEDLNMNGIYEPDRGETDPSDSSSKTEPKSDKYKVIEEGCKAEDILNGEDATYLYMRVAKMPGCAYTEADASGSVAKFDDSTNHVVGLFGSKGGDIAFPPDGLLNQAKLTTGSFVADSSFKSTVPMASWLESKIYKKEFQIIPDHTVDRVKYTITLGSKGMETLESVRNLIADKFGQTMGGKEGKTTCPDNKALLYVARSVYDKKTYIYSIALSCANPSVKAQNILDDVISGTLVSPLNVKDVYDGAPTGGYKAYQDFICQAEEFGQSAGNVDFLWVIDNSGSMADELSNVVATVDEFAKQLASSGIDYRIAITTTDAYLLDESPTIYETYDANSNPKKGYMNVLGIRTAAPTIQQNFPGFFGKTGIQSSNGSNNSVFVQNVKSDSTCQKNNNTNTCGKGYEDGFKSGALTLSRLSLDVDNPDTSKLFQSDAGIVQKLREVKMNIACKTYTGGFNEEACKSRDGYNSMMDNLKLRDKALKYIIWVTDEESRQFKEEQKFTSVADLIGCRTGYKLTGSNTENITSDAYDMATGAMQTGTDDLCNESMTDGLEKAINDGSLAADLSLEEIKALGNSNPTIANYYKMLKYYLDRYQLYAGEGGITGFALVGDRGRAKGDFCKRLAVCTKGCIKDGQPVADSAKGVEGCDECDENSWEVTSDAKTGANYGLSYIHLARFLGWYNNGAMDGKEGGYASVCNDSFQNTVSEIFKDVAGRVASHNLKGYPIASTIKVVANIKGNVVTLTRGADKNGWNYDASQNAITFSGVDAEASDYIAISYVIWQESQG